MKKPKRRLFFKLFLGRRREKVETLQMIQDFVSAKVLLASRTRNPEAAAEVEEKGKGAVVRPLLKKDDAIDNLRVRAGKKKAEGLRYLDGQVVLVSCVLWL